MTEQREVYEYVSERGYRGGWSLAQFAVRQVLKLIEEIAEMALVVDFQDVMTRATIAAAGSLARATFDGMQATSRATVRDYDALREELADIQVVVFALAEALDFDVVQAAIRKSRADVARGVRANA